VPFSLVAEQPKQLTGREEAALLQRAFVQRESPAIRLKLAQLHNRLDMFDAAIELLDAAGPPANFVTARCLFTALMGRGERADIERAVRVAEQGETLADCPFTRAEALEIQAEALLRLGEVSRAEPLLDRALEFDHSNDPAFRMLSGLWLDRGEADRVLALAEQIEAAGSGHSQLLGIMTMALTQRGDLAAAHELAGLDRFLFTATPPAPEGWPDLPSFHAALARELFESPGLRHGRHGTASVESLRVDEPVTAATPAFRALQQLIVNHVSRTAAGLPEDGHPWLRMRPASAQLRIWSVITGPEGRERWHMHPQGWATGGYYVEVPDRVQRGNSPAGCLEFGLSDYRIGQAAAESFGARLVRPQPGLLTLFPSHAYHRTHPHGAEGRRICVAFDLIPA
jgi:uncharacterized protein (TIGR02466 family)